MAPVALEYLPAAQPTQDLAPPEAVDMYEPAEQDAEQEVAPGAL